jgi:regulator of protease activity HflC (stomatin/prohibitin superfamily)
VAQIDPDRRQQAESLIPPIKFLSIGAFFIRESLIVRPERRNAMLFSGSYLLYLTPAVLLVAFILIGTSVRILREYERAVVFTLGRFQKVKGPGLVLLIPFFQEMVRVDLRIQVIEIPTQDVISRDNVSMKVDAVLYFNVVNPERAIIQVQHYLPATNMLAQTTLRAVLGQHELDEMLSERKKLSTDVQSIIDSQTETWGIKVSNVEIRTVELTENMVRAIAKQAEAERDRRAKIIHAEAEFQASQTLVNAAKILSSVPAAMQLRYLQTLAEIGAEQNSTVVFPMPIDIIKPFLKLIERPIKATGANGAANSTNAKETALKRNTHPARVFRPL